ncbi:FUSC family protein [Dongia deserti]|uniref:FUSC family protein n=1 Tax=Dongia deserti TaxID=2268030 RepID=UPI0013C44307|nr:FUSC family protein [Dongia deserti]
MPSFLHFLTNRTAELRLAVRVTSAAILAFALAKLLGFAHGYWAVITAIIVMQTSVGGSLKAALDRLLGTMAGALYGAAIAIAIPHATTAALAAAMVAAILPLALLAGIKPGFKAAPITAFIVLVPLSGQEVAPLTYALDRILEITIGSLVGLATSLIILPARAHQMLAQVAARAASLNADLMAALFEGLIGDAGRPGLRAQHAAIRKALVQAENAAEEALRERKSYLTDSPDPEPLVRTLYRLRHDLVMVGRAATRPLPAVLASRLAPKLVGVRDAGSDLLRAMAEALRTHHAAPSLERFETALRDYVTEMDAVWKDSATQVLAAEDAGRIFALRFALEQMIQDCRDLTNRINEFAGKKPSVAA